MWIGALRKIQRDRGGGGWRTWLEGLYIKSLKVEGSFQNFLIRKWRALTGQEMGEGVQMLSSNTNVSGVAGQLITVTKYNFTSMFTEY